MQSLSSRCTINLVTFGILGRLGFLFGRFSGCSVASCFVAFLVFGVSAFCLLAFAKVGLRVSKNTRAAPRTVRNKRIPKPTGRIRNLRLIELGIAIDIVLSSASCQICQKKVPRAQNKQRTWEKNPNAITRSTVDSRLNKHKNAHEYIQYERSLARQKQKVSLFSEDTTCTHDMACIQINRWGCAILQIWSSWSGP